MCILMCKLKREIKNKRDQVVRNWEMLATTKVKMRGSKKKVNGNTFKISSIKLVTRKFLEVSIQVVVEQNNGKEMYKKSVLHVQSCFFAN